MNPPASNCCLTAKKTPQAHIDTYKAAVSEEGDKIYETINMTVQPQISMVVMDQSTGYVKGIVGGRGEKTESLSLNRATDTTRQPGSTFKVVAAYAAAPGFRGHDPGDHPV